MHKFLTMLMVLVGLMACFKQSDGQTVRFSAGEPIYYQGEAFVTKHGASPLVVDWDGDRINDLIVGYHFGGWLYFYKNTGSNAHPEFNSEKVILKADGKIIAFENM